MPDDKRYYVLQTRPKPIYYNNEIKIISIKRNFSYGIVFVYTISNNSFFTIYKLSFDEKKSKITKKYKYILDKNNIWRRVVSYTM